MEDNFSYDKLISESKCDFKKQILNQIGVDLNFEIKTINDIALLQSKFAEVYPFNSDIEIDYRFEIDHLINKLIQEKKGAGCAFQNVVFGSLLKSLGINVQLIKGSEDGKHSFMPNFKYHYTNIIRFDGKIYYVESCLTFWTNYTPIEIGNEIGQNSKQTKIKTLYRVIKNPDHIEGHDETFIYQKKETNSKVFTSIFQFDLNQVKYNNLVNVLKEITSSPINKSVLGSFTLFLKFKDGFYFYKDGVFKTKYYNGNETTLNINNNTQLLRIMSKYFKIDNTTLDPNLFN